MKQKVSAFTLVEVIIALTLFSFVIVGVIFAVTRAYRYVENSKMQVMAVNLAREWIEMIYAIRDTNRRKYSWDKDRYWLKADPFWTSTALMSEGYYTLDMKLYSGQQYPSLTKRTATAALYTDISPYLSSTASTFQVSFTWEYHSGNVNQLMSNEADFYRIIYIAGLYDKSSGNTKDTKLTSCVNVGNCATVTPKELRFCVKVFAVNTHVAQAEICSMMTNFKE